MLKLGKLWIKLWEPSDIVILGFAMAITASALICLILSFREYLEKLFPMRKISRMLKAFILYMLTLMPLLTAIILYKRTYVHIGFLDGNSGLDTIWLTRKQSISFATLYGSHWMLLFLLLIWISVFLFRILHTFVKNKKFIKGLKALSVPCEDPDTLQLQKKFIKELKLKTPIPIWESDAVDSPFIIGGRRLEIFFPRLNASFQEKKLILHHEFIHCKDREYLYHNLLFILCSLYWFSPFFHIFAKYYIGISEMACDEQVLDHQSAKNIYCYGKLLSEMGQQGFEQNFVALTGGTKSLLEKRLEHMLKERKKRGKGIAILLTLIFLVVCFSMTFTVSLGTSELQDAAAEQLAEKEEAALDLRNVLPEKTAFSNTNIQIRYINASGEKTSVSISNGKSDYTLTIRGKGTYEFKTSE